jgi:hypothetical protein
LKTKIAVGVLLLMASLFLFVSQGDHTTGPGAGLWPSPEAQALAVTQHWPATPRLAARLMVEKYGPPQRMTPARLEWEARWPWKRISVDAARPSRPLEQVVDYYVPNSQLVALSRYPHGLIVYADRGELAARSDQEQLNRLTLNLANDIATGKRTPEQASRFYSTAVELSAAGKSSAYLERLLFEVVPEDRLRPQEAYPF